MVSSALGDTVSDVSRRLRERKRELGISEERLATLAGLSRTAVRQILKDASKSSAANLWAVASTLGLRLQAEEQLSSYAVRRNAALEKARRLVALVQGNSCLELQGLEPDQLEEMVQQTADELMAGSARNLWN